MFLKPAKKTVSSDSSSATEETGKQPPLPVHSASTRSAITLFVSKDVLAKTWFFVAVLAVGLMAWDHQRTIGLFTRKPWFVVVGPGTY